MPMLGNRSSVQWKSRLGRRAMNPLDALLVSFGYKLVEDAWQESGRKTYLHHEDASRDFVVALANDLRSHGWVRHPEILRAFRHTASGEIIEVEPGGAETTGHFLHFLKMTNE